MANGKKKDYRKDPLAGGKGGRSLSSRDVTALGKAAKYYGAARGVTGGQGGRSVASEAMAYLYRLAKGASGGKAAQGKMGGAKPKKKNPAMKWSPKGGKGMKKGGRVRRKR